MGTIWDFNGSSHKDRLNNAPTVSCQNRGKRVSLHLKRA